MKNLTFKIIDNADNSSHNWLGFQKIKVLERVLFRTVHHDSPERMSVPEYILDCIADGEFHRIQEDELWEQIGCGNYELDGKS
tara:strand:- start:86 stop:334 length:249 start_codon:yes stop_codon:yes gene_type:complete